MLTLWNPQRDLFSWSRNLDELFGSSCSGANGIARFSPAVDIEECDDSYVLHADIPGVDEKAIELSIHEGTLFISGKRDETVEEKDKGRVVRERRYGAFQRRFRLGPHIDASKIAANYNQGVLTVTLPKKGEAKPRTIPVKAN